MTTPPFDVIIRNGRVIDGTGNPWFIADVGVAGGRVVCPGFVDAHVHGDLALFMDPDHEPAVRQGVTTYVIGQDGVAMAPASPATLEYMCRYTAGFSGIPDLEQRWSSVA